MNRTFFARWSLLILCVVAFMVPVAMRGARFSLQSVKNDVKDWLPADFPETAELKWFGDHFLGERFIVVTWPNCNQDDQRFKLLVKKLRAEGTAAVQLNGQAAAPKADELSDKPLSEADDGSDPLVPEGELAVRETERARTIGDRHGLFATGEYHENWGGRGEKWLLGHDDQWYFITPDGELSRWDGSSSLVGAIKRAFTRNVMGEKSAEGEPVALLGYAHDAGEPNSFYTDPRQLTARYFASVTTGPELLEQLAGPDGPLWPVGSQYSDEEKREIAHGKAQERLTGTLFGPDGQQTCIILTLSDVGKKDLSRVLGRKILGKPLGKLRQLATNECGISAADLKLGGPPVDNLAIDEEGKITLVRLVGYSLALGLVLSLFCFRSVRVTLIVFLAGGISAVVSLAIVYWTRGSVDAVLMSMPSLVYVLGLSGAVHIVNYYRDACVEHGVEGAPERALRHGWWPCTLAAFTTALGLLSLATSHILPIQKFGFYSALGVLATLVLLFVYLPAALQIFSPNYSTQRNSQPPAPGLIERFWDSVCKLVVRRWGVVMTVCGAMMVLAALGLPKITTSVQLLKLFDANAKIIDDYRWLEGRLGKLVPMELVVRVAPSMQLRTAEERGTEEYQSKHDERFQLNFLERMELAARVQEVVEIEFGEQGRDIVGRAMSAASFAPDLPGPAPPSVLGRKANMRRAMYRKLEDHRDEILAADYLRVDRQEGHQGSELWRISLRLGALNDVDYGEFVHEVKDVVEPVLSAYRDRLSIFNSIAAHVKEDEGLGNARVLFLGINKPKSEPKSEVSSKSAAAGGEAVANPTAVSLADEEIDVSVEQQQNIYAATLRDLMTNAGVKSAWITEADKWAKEQKTVAEWTQDEWKERLKIVDCVVLLDDLAHVDADFLKANCKSFLDARDNYRFKYSPQDPMPTAAQQDDAIQVIYTGVVPVVYKAQRTLLTSLINSIGWAFVMIAGVMMLLLRGGQPNPLNLINVRGGLLSMIPNIFPVVIIFGLMGHLNINVDIGSMMTASVAMGVAVDDTIHLLNWFRTGIKQGLSRVDAVKLAYSRVATAMTQTTLIGGLGLSVFALSTFTPTQRFGVLMLALLVAALVGDLVFLPALLASPLGKFFCPRRVGGSAEGGTLSLESAPDTISAGPLLTRLNVNAPLQSGTTSGMPKREGLNRRLLPLPPRS